jgi:alpha-glucosidase
MKLWAIFIGIIMMTSSLIAQTQEWWRNAAVYQIYPRSYQDSNGDGIGDLEGIISRLDYIKSMGFTAIWVSPFFESPQADFGYDISNYRDCAPEYGTLATIDKLIYEVHQRDMHIIFDMVMNHTSNQHPWFLESKSSKDNPKRDWYVWHDGKGKNPPTNWKAMIGGNGWQYDAQTKQWFWATFLPFQPDLNYHNPEVRQAMLDNVRFWLDKGVDGFRLDIFNALYEDNEFRDNPFAMAVLPNESNPDGFFQHMEHTINHPGNFAFAKELRSTLEEYSNPPRYLVGEVFGDAKILKQYIGEQQDGLHTVFLFEMLAFKFNAEYFHELIAKLEGEFPYPYTPTWVFSNHDRKRSISRMGNSVAKAKLLAMLQMTVRGVSFTYMGEEIGMKQASIPLKQAKDSLAIRYRWIPQFLANMAPESLNRDECRAPMQWDSTPNSGFCPASAQPWLPVTPGYDTTNVATQEADPTSLLTVYRRLLHLKQSHKAFASPVLELVPADSLPKNVLGYYRGQGVDRVLVLLNFNKDAVDLPIMAERKVLLMLSQPSWVNRLEGYSGVVLE